MPRHIPSLDGLRAIAVLMVLWCHIPLATPGYPEWLGWAHWLVMPGNLGVELFFALSGFLITRILLDERERGLPVRWFLLRRVLRIFPIYYLLLAVMAFQQPSENIGWAVLYFSNFRDTFGATIERDPLGHIWSLCVEEHFYLLWPLAVAWLSPTASRRTLTWILIPTAIVLGFSICLTMPQSFRDTALQRLSPIRFGTLAAGALVAYSETWLRAQPQRMLRIGMLLTAIGLIIHPHLWFIIVPVFYLEVQWWPIEIMPICLRIQSAIFATGILLWCLTPSERLGSPARLLSLAPLRAIGRISYGLYLYHLPIYHWLLYPSRTAGQVGLAVMLTLAVATASYWIIERPILRYARRFAAS
ncbi:acyltransferase [bacterium]|nr:acyltransferase [bacterium]